ncbi:RHS repeat domain-containing protein [Mucilaginibacter sp. AW1-7]|uniref:RHS repeat domain-containing protein n=1 Tax=Mucilaginibacter sp. AW1-7 TaxID=3349874 RepID=UPI003F737EBF
MFKNLTSWACVIWLMVLSAFAQDIKSQSAIVLPISPQTSYTVGSGATVNIVSGVSVALQPGTTLSSGSTVYISINNVQAVPAAPSNPANDYDKNWILTRNYDENGNEIGSSKAFFDNNGKLTQSQTKNETTGHVLASQTIYDLQGRAVVATLPAPINNSAFAYNSSFVTKNGVAYNYLNFDGDPTSTTNPYAKLNSPDAVDNTTQGSLGWYYSNNNSLEPMVATTGYPYSRGDFYHDGTGATKRSAGVGDQLKMGMGHEASSNSFPVQNELNNYLAIRNQFFPAAVVGEGPANMAAEAVQSVSTDQNGTSVLSVTDLSGKQNLMTGRADPNGWLSITNTANMNNVLPQYTFSITVDGPAAIQGNTNDPAIIAMMRASVQKFSLNSAYQVTVTCTNGGVATWQGNGNDYIAPTPGFTGSYSFVITSAYPFYVTASNNYGVIYDQAPVDAIEPNGTSMAYFKLAVPSAVSVTGNVALYDMSSETQLSNFTSGSTLPAGYYKAIDTNGDASITYTNKYSDISYNYYNQLGQLIASIAPNGVQALVPPNNLNNYASASALPFVTLYEYDLQGRLTASTSPDGGRSEFVYRTDGKIRFSQNALQRVAANAGTGNQEKFSYTNYDSFGRPIESGEYTVPNGASLTFASTKSNTTLLDNTGASDGLTGGVKLNQVNTYYDLPAANLSLSGYIQDPGFLKGAVSYTTNANSTTWYNYDDHGRVVWMVKQIAGLTGYKTIDYTYNDQGNGTVVDYQRGTAAERFMHYYSYDADGRLINVQTSINGGTTKLQQAHYYYYLHGPLKRTELGDQLQGIDYVYTADGMLKAINSPTGNAANDPMKDGIGNYFAKDAFGMQLEYFPGDYTRTGSNVTSIPTGQQTYYNGNVNGISWQSNKPSGILPDPTMYAYGYDAKYQLTGATWGTPNFTTPAFTPGNMFKESGITYDPNGNINGLQRTKGDGTLRDDFSKYTYQAGTNKLTSVANTAGSLTYASYTYDELGQLKSQTQGNATSYLKYDVTGKITGVYSDAAMTAANAMVTYSYDESGNRIKTVNQNGTTYYVYDASGNVMAIYTGASAPVMSEVPVYGSDRLGTYYVAGNIYYYELRDNVGSVKVVINRNKVGGQADVVQYNDYYPFGSIARNSVGYRYGYQGAYAEQDPVTGLNNFDLRMYDGKIGRWLSTDPAGQYASPYEGMGNNPVIGIDPTGGYDHWWQSWAASLFGLRGSTFQDHSGGINDGQYYFGKESENQDGSAGVTFIKHYGEGSAMNQLVNHVMTEVARQEYMRHKKPDIGAVESPIIDPIDFVGGFVSGGLKGLAATGVRAGEAELVVSGIQVNKIAGDAFRDELAAALRAEGRVVTPEAYKWTPFGKRFIDLDVWHNGVNLGGIETKVGGSRYLPLQRLKDAWLGANGYNVQLVRKPPTW